MPPPETFDPELLRFLIQLKRNNNREWFQRNKSRYEMLVRDPLLRFIAAFAPKLHAISPHLVADARPVGGSLFRIYRDTRFSRDKRPLKTWAAVQFRHVQGKDVHAPGFYLHIEPGNVFAGCGLWHPDASALAGIREGIADDPPAWRRAVGGKAFRHHFTLAGDVLKRAPRGFDPDHPLIEDIKRKDFIAVSSFSDDELLSPAFATEYARRLRTSRAFMSFLTSAVGVAW